MKLAAAVCALATGVASLARGEPICVPGTLASYVALGAQGCSAGSSLLSNFEILSGINLSSPISPSAINITPIVSATDIGLTLNVSANATGGAILESLISYRISGGPFTAGSISAGGTSTTGNGAVTDIQNFCLGGSFGPSGVTGCSTGQTGSLLLLGDGSVSQSFAAATSLNVTDDITFDSGGSGTGNSAAGGVFTDRFTSAPASVPEPGTLTLLIAGAFSYAFIRLRNRRLL
jgi:hypothetical protein